MTASFAAYYCQVRVAHAEEGIKTLKKIAPFPRRNEWENNGNSCRSLSHSDRTRKGSSLLG